MNRLKRINLYVAIAHDMELEYYEMMDLFSHLNKALSNRNVELNVVLNSYPIMGSSGDCELCLLLYHKKFGDYTKDDFEADYNELQEERNPRKIYIFFKDTEDATEELQEFKDSIERKYGHFICRFENVDTMRLNFLLQLEAYQNNNTNDGLLKVENQKIRVDEQDVVDLNNVPFTSCNKLHNELKDSLENIEELIEMSEVTPEENMTDEQLSKLYQRRKKKSGILDKISKLENDLLNTALNIVSLQGIATSKRLREAIELFNSGNNEGADVKLDPKEIENDAKQNVANYKIGKNIADESQSGARLNIQEWRVKAMNKMLLNDENRFNDACFYYKCGIKLAKDVELPQPEYISIVLDYVNFLQDNNQYNEAISLLREILDSYNNVIFGDYLYLSHIATAQNSLGVLYLDSEDYKEAKNMLNNALDIRYKLNQAYPNKYSQDIAITQNKLAILYFRLKEYGTAEKFANQALSTHNTILDKDTDNHIAILAEINNSLACIFSVTDRLKESEKLHLDVLKLRTQLTLSTELYDCLVADSHYELGKLYNQMYDFRSAEKYISLSLKIFRELAKKRPQAYLPKFIDAEILLGDLYFKSFGLDRRNTATDLFSHSYKILKYLCEDNNDVYLNRLAGCQFRLGRCSYENSYYRLALDNYKILQDNNDLYRNNIAECLISICEDSQMEKDYISAVEAVLSLEPDELNTNIHYIDELQDISVYTFIHNLEPLYLKLLAVLGDLDEGKYYIPKQLLLLGSLYNNKHHNNPELAEKYYLSSLKGYEKLVEIDSNRFLLNLTEVNELVGNFYMKYFSYEKARKYLTTSLNLYRDLGGNYVYGASRVESALNSIADECCSVESEKKIINRVYTDSLSKDIEHYSIPSGYTEIGESAFEEFNFSSVVIPDSVITINNKAFSCCANLKSITFPKNLESIGDEAFEGCKLLNDIVIPESVRSMGKGAFSVCKALENIVIPKQITEISESTFELCENLKSIELPNSIVKIGASAFLDCYSLRSVTIPNSVEQIGWGAFVNCKNLEHISIGDSVNAIISFCFLGCENLSSVTLSNSLQSIDAHLFKGCTSLKTITIPESVKTIENYAFEGCCNLETVILPSTLESIENRAFINCSNLKKIQIPHSIENIGKNCFEGCNQLEMDDFIAEHYCCSQGVLYDENRINILFAFNQSVIGDVQILNTVKRIEESAFTECKHLTSIIIPNSIGYLGPEAFFQCSNLESVTLSKNIKSIYDYTFMHCKKLSSITIPNSVTDLGELAFGFCEKLKDITIPQSVEEIKSRAFHGCVNLTTVTFLSPSTKIANGEDHIFLSCNNLETIYIPKGSMEHYSVVLVAYIDELIESK